MNNASERHSFHFLGFSAITAILIFSFIALTGCTSTASTNQKSNNAKIPEHITADEDVVSTLSDPEATIYTKRLYNYIRDVYGKKVITGQMENAWDDSYNQLQQVYDKTQKYPALMGFDFMNYTSLGWSARNQQIERAVNFWNGTDYDGKKISDNQGLVAFCWHWRDPTAPRGKTGSFAPKETQFRIPYDTDNHAWKTDTVEYKEILADLDVIARELSKLQYMEVPVIWRPMHEGAGNLGLYGNTGTAWFWWGAGNSTTYNESKKEYSVSTNEDVCAECYIALWKLMYDYFTNTKGIHNLIWLWNGQNKKFYPGSEYVDIIGVDIYPRNNDYSSQSASFNKYSNIDITKPITLSECGVIPSLEKMQSDGAMWSYFMVWNDGKKGENDENFWNGQAKNPDTHKLDIYQSDLAITLDKVPDLLRY